MKSRRYTLMSLGLILLGANLVHGEDLALAKIKVSAALRFQHEYTSKTGSGDKAGTHKEKMRARAALFGDVTDRISAKVQISTADDQNPTSTNSTMTNNANKKGMYLDLAYVDWKACDCNETPLMVTIGKQNNPYRSLSESQIIYDGDYTPEGLTIVHEGNLIARAGIYSILERKPQTDGTSEPDSGLMVAMLGHKGDMGPAKYFATASYHDFTNLKDNAALTPGFDGNSQSSGSRYIHEYKVGELQLQFTHTTGSWKVDVYADAIQNFAIEKNNTGWIAGFAGKQNERNPWMGGYAYQIIDKDATVGALTDSYFANGNTGGFGHIFKAGKGLADNTTLVAYWYHVKVDNDGSPFWTNKGLLNVEFKL